MSQETGLGIRFYRDLIVWQKSLQLVKDVYDLIAVLPKHENFAMADQMRRSAISVPCNIAEGHARQHPKEFRQFLYSARGSLAELDTLCAIATRVGYIDEDVQSGLQEQIDEVMRMIAGILSKLR